MGRRHLGLQAWTTASQEDTCTFPVSCWRPLVGAEWYSSVFWIGRGWMLRSQTRRLPAKSVWDLYWTMIWSVCVICCPVEHFMLCIVIIIVLIFAQLRLIIVSDASSFIFLPLLLHVFSPSWSRLSARFNIHDSSRPFSGFLRFILAFLQIIFFAFILSFTAGDGAA